MSPLLITALVAQCLALSEPETITIFQPGHEARALDLIAPHTTDDLVLGDWSLEGMVPGPACAVRFLFVHDGEEVWFVLAPGDEPGAPPILQYTVPGAAPVSLREDLAALLTSNDPGAIFADACQKRVDEPRRTAEGVTEELPGPDVASRRHTFYTLLVLAPLVLLGFLLLRRREGAPARRHRPPRGRVALGGVILGAVLFRLVVARTLGPGDLELESFPQDMDLWALSHVLGSFVYPPPPQTFHAPLLVSLLQGWSLLGDALGVGGQLLWIRLPNLALAGLMVWLLLRLGEALGDSRTGWIASVVFAVSPVLVYLTVPQGPYFLEMVTTTWFLERLATCAVAGRPAHRSLAVAAALALWSGFLSALVVGPGLLLHGILAWRRGDRRRALGVIFLTLALTAPIVGTALSNTLDMASISRAIPGDSSTEAGFAAIYGHRSLEPAAAGISDAIRMIWNLVCAVVGVLAAAPMVLALLLYPVVRRWEGLLPPLILLVFAALGTFLPIRLINLLPVIPLILVGGIRGTLLVTDRLLPRVRRSAVAVGLSACILAGSLVTESVATLERTPLIEDVAGWMTRGTPQGVMDVARTPEHGALPLVRGTRHRTTAYLLCPDRDRRAGTRACCDREKRTDTPGFLRYRLGDREVWELRLDLVRTTDCPASLNGDGPLADLEGPFLLALDTYFLEVIATAGCRDPRTGFACRPLATSPEIELWRCEE
ncbi:MAG: hypothetical protein ABIK09_12250 [Pseudomonadota bacterium]